MKYSLITREPISDIAFSEINGVKYHMPSIFGQFEDNGWCLDDEQGRRVLYQKEKVYNIKLTNGRDSLFVDLTNPLNFEQNISNCCVVGIRVFNDQQNNAFKCRIMGGIELGVSKCRDVKNWIGIPKELDIHRSYRMGLYFKVFKYNYFGYIVSLYFEGECNTDCSLMSINTYCSNEITANIRSDGSCEYSGYGRRNNMTNYISEDQITQFNMAWQNQTDKDVAVYVQDYPYIRAIISNLNNSYYKNIDNCCLTISPEFDLESRITLNRFMIETTQVVPFIRFNGSTNSLTGSYLKILESLDRGNAFVDRSMLEEDILVSLTDGSGKERGILMGRKIDHMIAFKYAHTFSTISRYRLNISRALLESLINSDLDLRNTKAMHANISGLSGVVFYDDHKEYFTPLADGLLDITPHRAMIHTVLYSIKSVLVLLSQSEGGLSE